MRNIYFPLLFIFSALILSCSGSKYTPVDIKTGNYSFSMSDSTGNTLVDGDMKIDTTSTGKVSGTYSFTKKYVSDFPGLSTMGGSFAGTYEKKEGMVHINMNPKLADANVYIGARVYRSSLAGEWSFTTIKGVLATGKFVAKSTD
jgi:hypothetical protein